MNAIIQSTLPTVAIASGLAGSVLTIVAMTVIAYLQRTVRSLSCRVTADRLVSIEGDEGYEDKVRVLYDDVDIQNLYRLEIGISNSGNQPVLPTDFIEPIKLTLEEPAKILTVSVVDQRPRGIGAKVCLSNREITVPALLMNPKDSFSIRSHIGDLEVEPVISGRIVGVKEITKKPSRISNWVKLMAGLATLAAIIGGVWTVLSTSVWALMFSYTGFGLMVIAIGIGVWNSHFRDRNIEN